MKNKKLKREKKLGLLIRIFVCLWIGLPASAQEKEEAIRERQLENQAERNEANTDDDSYWQTLEYLRTHKLDINTASAEDLEELQLLSELQITNLLQYQKLLGALVSIYELQAIPGWDVESIYRLLPFVTIKESETWREQFVKCLHNGEQTLLLRWLGDPSGVFFRYKYNYKNLLQYGVTGDNDTGEPFFQKPGGTGFDFYSIHLFVRRLGIMQSLAIGDFTVSMGQGLIQWQSIAFKKGAAVLDIKRQGPVLKPYTAAGEFNFYRGAGITLRHAQWETTFFGSVRKLSANLVADTLQSGSAYISSFITTGYHRTESELSDRNNVTDIAIGGTVKRKFINAQIGINMVQHELSHPLNTSGELYDRYAATGNRWSNYSFDYGYTFRNVHVFGEMAADKHFNKAMVNGVLVSLDAKTDVAIVYRAISRAYQSLFGNAFTESTYPTNENGLYAGISTRPVYGWRIDAFADLYYFPWLKYQVDAPSAGQDYLVQLTYTINKLAELYTRIKYEAKPLNLPQTDAAMHVLRPIPKLNWRTQVEYKVNNAWLLRNRAELVWYNSRDVTAREQGFLWLADIQYKPLIKPVSFHFRLQYFETGGYNSRIYAYESNGLYSFAIPAFFGSGMRWFMSANYRLSKKLSSLTSRKTRWLLGLFIGQSIYASGIDYSASSGSDLTDKKMAMKIQVVMNR